MTKKLFWNGYNVMKTSYIWVVYLIFAGYVFYLGITTPALGAKLFFLIIGLFVLGFTVYYELLKRLYGKMIESLTMETNIEASKNYRDKLLHYDYFNGFKKSLLLFDSLLLMDQGKFQECLDHMAENEQFFRSSIDYLFIYYHNQLHCFYFLKENEKALLVIDKLADFKKIKEKKYSPLFSWHEITGIQHYLQGRNQKALQDFTAVDVKLFNPREKTYLYVMMANCFRSLNQQQKVGEFMKLARENGHTLAIVRK